MKINSIYVIDDDPIILFGIRKMLNTLNLCEEVRSFANGKLALDALIEDLASGTLPDFIFLDINMPIMDGWQFMEEFMALDIAQTVPVNIITSSIDPYDTETWLNVKQRTHHPVGYSTKPITKEHIREILKQTTHS